MNKKKVFLDAAIVIVIILATFIPRNIGSDNSEVLIENSQTEIYAVMTELPPKPSPEIMRVQSLDAKTGDGLDLPSYFSWKDYNDEDWTTPVRYQGGCGSCWAFAAVGMIESKINIVNNNPNLDIDLSEQYILSCLSDAGSCSGGWMYSALYYIMDETFRGNFVNGVVTEDCFYYRGSDTVPCSDKCSYWMEDLWELSDYGSYISPSRDLIKQTLIEEGPLGVSFLATNNFISWGGSHHNPNDYYPYTGPVTYHNHAVLLVGYKDDPGVPNGGYWILKNSWGTSFGYNGFFNLEYEALGVEHEILSVDVPVSSGLIIDFTYLPELVTNQDLIYFNVTSNMVLDSWWWNFGDGYYSDLENPVHRFYENGSYTINLTVAALSGEQKSVSKIIEVPTKTILSDFTYSITGNTVTFTDLSYSSNGTIVSWFWDFDDGGTSIEQNPKHMYSTSGAYNVSLVVTDDEGDSDATAKFVTINEPPTVDVITPVNGSTETSLTPICEVLVNDAEGHTLAVEFYDNTTIGGGSYEGWQTENIHLDYSSIKWTQMQYDTDNNPHVAYVRGSDDNIYYAYRDTSGTWRGKSNPGSHDMVATTSSSLSHVYGIAIDSDNNPHIVFGNGTGSSVDYAVWNNNSLRWEQEIIDPDGIYVGISKMSIDIDTQNRPHVFYSSSPSNVKYAYKDDNIWRGLENTENPDTIKTASIDYQSMVLDSNDFPHLSWGDSTYWLWYANWDGNSWNLVNVSAEMFLPRITGFDTHIALDSYDLPYIACYCNYQDVGTDETAIFHYDGSEWSKQRIYHDKCDYPTIVIDNINTMFVGFIETDTKAAVVYIGEYGGNLIRNMIETTSVTYSYSCIDLMSNGSIGFAYTSTTTDLKYAYNYRAGGEPVWALRQTNNSVNANSIVTWIYNNADQHSTTYWWKVIVTDSLGGLSEEIYHFSTADDNSLTAFFTWDPLSPEVGDNIQFTDTSVDDNGTIISWSWDFDDGSHSSEQNPQHSYVVSGSYDVSLTVTDDDGDTDTTSQVLTVVSNIAPTASFTYLPLYPKINYNVQFTDTSTDTDGIIVSWAWDFDDGNFSSLQNPEHQYSASGTYDVSLTVEDDDGDTDTFIQELSVLLNVPPTSSFTYTPSLLKIGYNIQFTDISTDTDGIIIEWGWDFGDGNYSSEQNPQHSYGASGSYDVSLTVTDDDGDTDTTSQVLTVLSNTLPTVSFDYNPLNPTTNDNIQFTDTSVDVDGTIVSWAWDFGDRNFSSLQNPEHQYSVSGTYDVSLTVLDNDGGADFNTLSIFVDELNEYLDIEQEKWNIPHTEIYKPRQGAQSFIPHVSTITKVELYLYKYDIYGRLTGDITLKLKNSLDGETLASKTISVDDVPESWTWVEFDISDTNIVSGDTYYIIMSSSSSSDDEYVFWAKGKYTGYNGGAYWLSRNNGRSWQYYYSYDFCFKIYGI